MRRFFIKDQFYKKLRQKEDAGPIKKEIVDDFVLYDQEGRFQELYYYSDKKAVAIISQGNGCPIIRKSVPYLNQLKEKYRNRGIVFLMINANPQDDRYSMAEEAAAFSISLPILEDKAQAISKSLNIHRTAEAILIDTSDWSIIYHGAINDGLESDSERMEIKHHYLEDAIEAFLSGRPALNEKTVVKGCLINIENNSQSAKYEYTKNVAPILKKNCVVCHSRGGIAPWSMENYQTVKGWGPMIREVVRTKRMPPWHADPYYGEFEGDSTLSTEEEKVLLNWSEQNYARGEGVDPLAELGQTKKGSWILGEPDLIFRVNSPQTIPATGADEFRFIEMDRLVENDIWVRAIDIVPGNRKVVHHGNLAVEWATEDGAQNESLDPASEDGDGEKTYLREGLNMEKGSVISGYSPGTGPLVMPEDTGIFIPKGSKLVFRVHYITTGKQETDVTQVGIYLHKNKPAKILSVATMNNRDIRIRAGDQNYKRSAEYKFENDVTLVALQPHMHYRGKSMRFTIEYPDGTSEAALSVPNYRFHWQRRYVFKEPKTIPKGTAIYLEGYYDNSLQNPDNPDPRQEVVYGPYSYTEMFQGILFYINKQD